MPRFLETSAYQGTARLPIVWAMNETRRGNQYDHQHQTFPTVSRQDPETILTFAIDAARLLADDKCEEVVLLDVRNLSQVCDYIVVASGTSDRQMASAAEDVKKMAEETGHAVFRSNRDARTAWVVLDCVDVVVHVFEPQMRAHYDIEMLWGDAPHVEWRRPDQQSRDRAGLGGGAAGKGTGG